MKKKSIIIFLFIMFCVLFLNAATDNAKARELISKGYEAFQIYKNPSQAFLYYKQAIDLASGYTKASALLGAAYMSHLMGNEIRDYQNFIKDVLVIEPDMKLEPIDYQASFREVFNNIKIGGGTTVKPTITKPAPEPIPAQRQPVVTRPIPEPVPAQPQRSRDFSVGRKKAEESKMNIFVDLGMAASDFRGLFIEGGFQYGFGEFLIEYYFKPVDSVISNSAIGFNLNCVYKFNASDKVKIFIKSGVCLFTLSASVWGFSDSASYFGINLGPGLEIALREKMGIRAGSTFKLLFVDGETVNIFKFFGGFYFEF
ncbi:MAG: porin family protein [Candidatus Aminicenantes bacterium]|nr:porin family protein [Candidatus Aminicenantes bacterium]